MSTVSLLLPRREQGTAAKVLLAGAVVGVLDGLAAVLLYVVVLRVSTPVRVFQGIARALIGRSAFSGELGTAALGVAMHFGVALAWAAAYGLAYRYAPRLRELTRTRRGAVTTGLVLGVGIWLMMRLLVLPLTGAPTAPILSGVFLAMAGIHMVAVGLPIALIVRQDGTR